MGFELSGHGFLFLHFSFTIRRCAVESSSEGVFFVVLIVKPVFSASP